MLKTAALMIMLGVSQLLPIPNQEVTVHAVAIQDDLVVDENGEQWYFEHVLQGTELLITYEGYYEIVSYEEI